MNKFIKYFSIGVCALFFLVSLVFRELNVYTQTAWVLLLVTLALSSGVRLNRENHKGIFVFLALFYTLLIVLPVVF